MWRWPRCVWVVGLAFWQHWPKRKKIVFLLLLFSFFVCVCLFVDFFLSLVFFFFFFFFIFFSFFFFLLFSFLFFSRCTCVSVCARLCYVGRLPHSVRHQRGFPHVCLERSTNESTITTTIIIPRSLLAEIYTIRYLTPRLKMCTPRPSAAEKNQQCRNYNHWPIRTILQLEHTI